MFLRRRAPGPADDEVPGLRSSSSPSVERQGSHSVHILHPPESPDETQHSPTAPDLSAPRATSLPHLGNSFSFSSEAFCLLCSGSSLALLSQQLANNGISMPQAQIPAWTKYSANFLVSRALEASSSGWASTHSTADQPVPISKQQNAVLVAMGLLDVLGYGLSCVAFAKCGAALTMVLAAASGQICTALTRLLILRKPLTTRQCLAVAIVSVGLTVRALGGMNSLVPLSSSIDTQTAIGAFLVLLSALSYSLLGVAYEWLMQMAPGRMLTQAQINGRMSVVGVVAASAYQILYTWPRREQLVMQPLKSSGVAASSVFLLYAVFGGIFTVHSHLQGRMLGMHGALSVGITNAVRVVVVSLLSAALFCRPGSTSQCLTFVSGSSAVLVTAGAVLWATSPAARRSQPIKPPAAVRTSVSYPSLQQTLEQHMQELKND